MIVSTSLFTPLLGEVLIFTYSYNRPDFIEIQHKTFKKFLEDEYKFVVFNDAITTSMEQQINATCARLGIECIRIPQEIHQRPYLPREPEENYNAPSVRNVNVVQYSLQNRGFSHNDILVLLDSDVFMVKKINIKKMLENYDIAAVRAGNGYVTYLWHGLTLLDLKKLPNIHTLTFNCGKVNGKPIDAGGHSYYYLKENPTLKILFFTHYYSGYLRCSTCQRRDLLLCPHNTQQLKENGFDEAQVEFLQKAHNVEFFHNNSFLHYRGGTNWDNKNKEYHLQKTRALHTYLEKIFN